ncbi:putative thioredoxin-dependent peroxiredoxin [Helianthus annuus]|uniref:glutaredoxin-dependent peroxiredoxin n=1 Tax=Helianthus annuus TaxID=4232 RepID=A0A251VAK5_HELAN|nr:putative peroxiredoxin [Helianthus annuus]KAJ0539129.1 putative thioredoxin-dependent peroxiredoxin [Helianthus annuus]KAJ0547208.1 putative thioredoxin-dependent peroxiredoxin [Helianthus annuus]KAJ0553779.1 putative thioredoxin-dependent peroxiredoxin [Helianthus annuus]KAJ0719441.1 putative thioredoxin-dependent peroxiredoxin [Helianthus annuus]
MAPIKVGDSILDGSLAHFDEKDEMQQVSVHSLAAGKKVVIFGVHSAFTPTCSMKHVPRLIEKSEELKSKGVEEFLLISVNDPFVMKAWKKSYPETKKCEVLSRRVCNRHPCPWYELDLICKVKVGKGSLSFK